MDLRKELPKVFPDVEFDNHESDLYVKVVPGLMEWLKENYQFYSNIERFTSQIDGTPWIDIPFADHQWWEKRGM